ncbi:CCHC-type and RNA-binding motif-containing protein 1 [Seminavis robusta]|uniref:CCHC-type and RNA-binding motif-containing protein 1 n=1 Tax=Seminavis robusta TaxID=568900 RepID=A0A9N8HDG9_9STRA|nr:CCHC-type and RNA-binding motif-containing protein 1 [Seminavis robusta]|eukprot:Sro427_g140640.1 CCHC-type and RNA-binding motif-containing protein 1 (491) ;mRNA; f:24115-26146
MATSPNGNGKRNLLDSFDDAADSKQQHKSPKKKKRSKVEDDMFAPSPATDRKASLSKFVRRILDPNRKPTGLIEPPQVIPLNDEFLKAFGKREKEMDAEIGRTIDIDNDLADDDKEDDKDANDTSTTKSKEDSSKRKIKVTNLKYTTAVQTLREECMNFGPVVDVNMLMDDNDPTKNTGRAYVVFSTAAAAQAAVDQQLGGDLDGRPIRVSLAEEQKRTPGNAFTEKRYWLKDISTKCYRCGNIGHMEAECPNPQQASICPLCANIHGGGEHEMRHCPLNRVCFNCGIPGHINRECSYKRGSVPPRQICSICCGSGHTRFQCPRSNVHGIEDAICLVCGKTGHFMCSELKWFFGLEGVFCFNCGGKGHVGQKCQRPILDDLVRNEGWTLKEIERAEEYKLAEDVEAERMEQERKDREEEQRRTEEREQRRERYRDKDRQRARSAPRPRGGQEEYRYTVDDNDNNNNNSRNSNNRRGYGGGSSGGRRRGYR